MAVLGLVIGVLATAATMAVAGLQPADLNFTPRTEAQTTNVDVARAWAKNYYGAHSAVAGPNGTWYTPLNLDSNYANEARSVADQSDHWLSARRHVPHRAIVLDVDDTTLTTWNYDLQQLGLQPDDERAVRRHHQRRLQREHVPADARDARPGQPRESLGLRDLLDHRARRFAARRDDREPRDDSAAGLPDIDEVTLNGHTIPEVDAGYPLPTPIDTGHGGFTDGLFTKPPPGSYPAYLDKPEFCRAVHHRRLSCPTVQYKSGTRAYIESQGYDIVADLGDQFSDLQGGFADKTFKMPNPNYYLP